MPKVVLFVPKQVYISLENQLYDTTNYLLSLEPLKVPKWVQKSPPPPSHQMGVLPSPLYLVSQKWLLPFS